MIVDVHRAYYEAGADIVETDTFGSMPLVLAEYGLEHKAREISAKAAQLARQAAEEYSKPGRPRFVAGSMGPTTKAISVVGGVTFPELIETYYVQAQGLIEGGADMLLLETCNDARTVKAGLLAIDRLGKELGFRIPTMVSGTIEQMGTMLAGQTAEAFWASVSNAELLSLGLNCATGPDLMTDHIRSIHELTTTYVSCYPNAGFAGRRGQVPGNAGEHGGAVGRSSSIMAG